jgi:hypothetical protein
MITISNAWRKVLSLRSKKNRIAIGSYNRPSYIRDALIELKKSGYIVYLDRDVLVLTGTVHDFYLLTRKGVELCEKNNISRKDESS